MASYGIEVGNGHDALIQKNCESPAHAPAHLATVFVRRQFLYILALAGRSIGIHRTITINLSTATDRRSNRVYFDFFAIHERPFFSNQRASCTLLSTYRHLHRE